MQFKVWATGAKGRFVPRRSRPILRERRYYEQIQFVINGKQFPATLHSFDLFFCR
jgi:hypothetical protein